MATNALLVEFGVDKKMSDEDMQGFQSMLGMLGAFKESGAIEDFRYYAVVTGNRNERIGMMLLEGSDAQVGALVADKPWAEFHDLLMDMCTNVTVNRSITLERMMQLMSS